MAKRAVFGIIGGSGFRAQFYLRIAQALPDRFTVNGMVVRDEEKGRALERQWHIPTYRNVDQLLEAGKPDFVVLSVSKDAAVGYMLDLAERGIPVLAETPPAPTLEGLLELHEKLGRKGAKIQVAEQYQYQPMHAARYRIVRSGRLGNITQATVSISQFYHAVSLIRKMLGIGFEEAAIRAMRFESPPRPERSTEGRENRHVAERFGVDRFRRQARHLRFYEQPAPLLDPLQPYFDPRRAGGNIRRPA
ncbi:Gfo/Idh/MocA family protein [Paenibacillus hamazuiensis]|uniref:Gfo/Idh/MocA family protein n=1 Tax=Paenibacillus hamazuiensis TaxID=2936508 RepID=UPI003084542B